MNSTLLRWSVPAICTNSAQRWFITLPSIGGGLSTRKQYEDQRVFPYTQEQIFGVVADVNRYHEFVPACAESTVFHSTRKTDSICSMIPGGQGTKTVERETVNAELVIGYPPFRERYTSVVAMERPWRIIATAAPGSGMFKHMKTVWEFIEQNQSQQQSGRPISPFMRQAKGPVAGTLVKFAIDFEFSSILHAQAASLAFDKVAKSNLDAYLKRCKQLYGH